MSSVLYEELCPREFLDRLKEFPAAYLPLGTLEWHGLHLPLGADGLQARGAMRMIAEKVGGIVLPMLYLGPDLEERYGDERLFGMDVFSFEEGHAQKLPGSAYHIDDDGFDLIIKCTLYNLARAGFKVIVAHGHGPSIDRFVRNREMYRAEFGLECYTLFDLAYDGSEGLMTDHAATNETSITMALHPELVHPERLSENEIPVGSWGRDPRVYASREYGDSLLTNNVEKAVEALSDIKKRTCTDLPSLSFTNVKSKLDEE